MRSSSRLAAVRCLVTTGYVSCPPRYAYPTASAPRSAIPASSACAASVRSTLLRSETLYPAMPHIDGLGSAFSMNVLVPPDGIGRELGLSKAESPKSRYLIAMEHSYAAEGSAAENA